MNDLSDYASSFRQIDLSTWKTKAEEIKQACEDSGDDTSENQEIFKRITLLQKEIFEASNQELVGDRSESRRIAASVQPNDEGVMRICKLLHGAVIAKFKGDQWAALKNAIDEGSIGVIQLILSEMHDVSYDEIKFMIDRSNRIEIKRCLLAAVTIVDAADTESFLSRAAYCNDERRIQDLFSGGITIPRKYGVQTITEGMNSALRHGHENIIRLLLSQQFAINLDLMEGVIKNVIRGRNFSVVRGGNLSLESQIACLSLIINRFNFSCEMKNELILWACQSSQPRILEMLLRQGAISSSLRGSAMTQAYRCTDENIRGSMIDMLNAAEIIIDDPVVSLRSVAMNVKLSDVQANPKLFLSKICSEGIPQRIRFTDSAADQHVIDLGGVTKQFISSLCEALIPDCHVTDGKWPLGEDEVLFSQMGRFFSLLYNNNLSRSDKILSGEIFNPAFFELVKIIATKQKSDSLSKEAAELLRRHIPTQAFCFNCVIDPSEENNTAFRKTNEEFGLGLNEDPLKESTAILNAYLFPAEKFYEGMTPEFQRLLVCSENPSLLFFQGQEVSSDLLLSSLDIEGTEPDYLQKVDWLKETIASSDKTWQLKFLKAVSGKSSMLPGMKILLRPSWRDVFEFHTCFNSLDLPQSRMDKETFLAALDGDSRAHGYNIP